MEIQKHLFRISERALKNDSAEFWWKGICYSLSAMALVFSLFFLFGHTIVLPNNSHLSSCLTRSQLKINNDSLYYVTESLPSEVELQYYKKKGSLVLESDECSIIANKNYSEYEGGNLMFGYDEIGMFMDQEKRDAMNYNNYTIVLKQVKRLRTIIFNFDNLVINELIDNPMGVFLKERLIVKAKTAFVLHVEEQLTVWIKLEMLAKVIIAYMVISIVTSLYIYGTIVAAPAVILILLKICNYVGMQGLNQVFKLFPWIGIHAIIRDTSPTPIIQQSTSQICKAMLFYFFFLYLIYYASIMWIDKRLFRAHVEMGLQELLFGYIALLEFIAIIFMRTRTFIKYFPAFHSLVLIMLLYYGQVCDFGFKRLACFAAFSISGAFFSWMVLKIELPAHTIWDPAHSATPKEDRPRVGYFPMFHMGWLKNLPDEWTLMMPLWGREYFTTRELSLVDRNNEELALALGNR